MELVKDIAIAVFSLAFLAGFLTMVFTGTGGNLKFWPHPQPLLPGRQVRRHLVCPLIGTHEQTL